MEDNLKKLSDEGVSICLDEFQRIRERVRASASANGQVTTEEPAPPAPAPQEPRTPSWDTLRALNTSLVTFPQGFNVHPKLTRAVERRRAAFDTPDGTVDWGHAETLA